jgi:hypothetical protein
MKNSSIPAGQQLKGFGAILLLGAVTAIFGFTGCASPKVANKTIRIDSDPVGMRVEVNGEDLGVTPTSYSVRANSKGDFAGAWGESPLIVFTVFPPTGVDGLYKQTKAFTPTTLTENGDRIPEKIFFDLHLAGGR